MMTCPTCRGAKEYMQEGCLIKTCKVCNGKGSVPEPVHIAKEILKVSLKEESKHEPDEVKVIEQDPAHDNEITKKKDNKKDSKIKGKESGSTKK